MVPGQLLRLDYLQSEVLRGDECRVETEPISHVFVVIIVRLLWHRLVWIELEVLSLLVAWLFLSVYDLLPDEIRELVQLVDLLAGLQLVVRQQSRWYILAQLVVRTHVRRDSHSSDLGRVVIFPVSAVKVGRRIFTDLVLYKLFEKRVLDELEDRWPLPLVSVQQQQYELFHFGRDPLAKLAFGQGTRCGIFDFLLSGAAAEGCLSV